MPRPEAKKMCQHWSAILYKLNRDLKDLEYKDHLISLQATTLHHDLMFVEGLIGRDPEKRFIVAVHQRTPSSLTLSKQPSAGRLSQRLLDKDYTRQAVSAQQLLLKGEKTDIDLEQKVHPIEEEVERRRKGIPQIGPDVSWRDRVSIFKLMKTFLKGTPKGYDTKEEPYRGERAVWPISLEKELRPLEEDNPLEWLPQEAGEELERVSLPGPTKNRYRAAIRRNRYAGAVRTKLMVNRWRLKKKERLRRKKILSNITSY